MTFAPNIILLCVLGFVSVWNIPNTIALRYFLGLIALIVIFISKPKLKPFFYKNKIVLIFFIYLVIYIFCLSNNTHSALIAFKSEWLKFFLFFLIAGGAAGILTCKIPPNKILLLLGSAFCVPLIIHLILWLKLFLLQGVISWRFTGLSVSHGDLGYTALSACLLLSPLAFNRSVQKNLRLFSAVGLIICFCSLLIAQSRGGLIFYFIVIGGTFLMYLLSIQQFYKRWLYLLFIPIFFLGLFIFQAPEINQTSKWTGMIEKANFGFIGEDPLKINCEGSELIRQILKDKGVEITPSIERDIESTEGADGARVLTARGAVRLVLLNPLGFDDTKLGYRIALEKYCGKKPGIMLDSAHNGWLDTALGIGIPGAILLLLIYMNFFKTAYHYKAHPQLKIVALSLMFTSIIWVIRACLDSSLRDQMLEMQIFTMAFLSSILITRDEGS
jgi:hypothetical protein